MYTSANANRGTSSPISRLSEYTNALRINDLSAYGPMSAQSASDGMPSST